MSTTSSGQLGEIAASEYLKNKGYKILGRNFRSKFGEIDLVAIDGDTLVFVEVKTRWNKAYGYPQEAVTPRKLRKIARTGEYFKLLNPQTPELLRIDVVAIEVEDDTVTSLELIKNASG